MFSSSVVVFFCFETVEHGDGESKKGHFSRQSKKKKRKKKKKQQLRKSLGNDIRLIFIMDGAKTLKCRGGQNVRQEWISERFVNRS